MLVRRALLPVATAVAVALCPPAATGQQRDRPARPPATDARSPPPAADDSASHEARRAEALAAADSVRASFVRPPPRPPRGIGEVLDQALKVALAPAWLATTGLVDLADLATAVVSPDQAGAAVEAVEGLGLDVGVGSIGPRSGEAIKVDLVLLRPLYLEGGYSLRRYWRLGAGLEFGDADERGVRIGYRYAHHAEPSFWGIGPDTEAAFESDFLWKRHLVTAEGGLAVAANLRLEAAVGFEDNRVTGGADDGKPDVDDTFDPSELFGFAERTRLVHGGAAITWDRRTWHMIQRRGHLLRFGATAWEGVGGTDTDFHRLEGEAQTYLPLTHRHALAFRSLAEMTRGASRPEIPFFHLADLGSTHGLRGFPGYRFRDRDLAALMTEYRYEVWRDEPTGMEGFLFLDVGGVARSLSELDRLHTSYGFGARFIRSERLLALWYLAFSREETRFALKFGWPF